jgi:hypothetical protein
VSVLQNWQLHVDTSISYTPGSTIYLNSDYKKVKNVSGTAKRYLQCHKAHSNEWDGYIPLSESDANRPTAQKGHSTTALGVPLDVPNIPNTCRIYINVVYQINPLRNYEQYTYSNTFRIIAGSIPLTQSPPDNAVQPQESRLPTPNTTNVYSTPAQSQPTIQPDIAQPVTENAPIGSSSQTSTSGANSGVVKRVTGAVTGTVNSLLNLAGL